MHDVVDIASGDQGPRNSDKVRQADAISADYPNDNRMEKESPVGDARLESASPQTQVVNQQSDDQNSQDESRNQQSTKPTEAKRTNEVHSHNEGNPRQGEEAPLEPAKNDTASVDSQEEKPLIQKLEESQKEVEELRESWTRERAEFMNFRKRIVQERERQANDTLSVFVQSFLPVLDNLDQLLAIKTQNEEVKKYVSGVLIIQEIFLNILNNKKVSVISPLNEEFNPQTMEAIASEEKADLDKDTVLEVYQRGYLIKTNENQQKMIRPARVRVGKCPSSNLNKKEC